MTPVVNETFPRDTTMKNDDSNSLSKTVKSTDYNFLSDSVFHGYKKLLKYYCLRYSSNRCEVQQHEKSDIIEAYGRVNYIGSIMNNNDRDSVFVLSPFTICDEGDSYYFTDTTLPRLETDSYCCHPDNLFLIGDIDEDGISEICLFYSSCVSRFKSLIAYTLKKNKWNQIGRCAFDVNFMSPAQTERVRKVGKGKFEMLEIIEEEKNKHWKQFAL